MRRLLLLQLASLASVGVCLHPHADGSGDARPGSGCNIDLTTKGLPDCTQACPEWCWATGERPPPAPPPHVNLISSELSGRLLVFPAVIGELQEYYKPKIVSAPDKTGPTPPAATPKCNGYECKVVTSMRKLACCTNSTNITTECAPDRRENATNPHRNLIYGGVSGCSCVWWQVGT